MDFLEIQFFRMRHVCASNPSPNNAILRTSASDAQIVLTCCRLSSACITIILIILQDVIIAQSLTWRTGIVFLGAVAGPLAAGYCYAMIRRYAPTSGNYQRDGED